MRYCRLLQAGRANILPAFSLMTTRFEAAETLSRSSSTRSLYVSRVSLVDACPNIRCSAFTLAPADTARLVHVGRPLGAAEAASPLLHTQTFEVANRNSTQPWNEVIADGAIYPIESRWT